MLMVDGTLVALSSRVVGASVIAYTAAAEVSGRRYGCRYFDILLPAFGLQ